MGNFAMIKIMIILILFSAYTRASTLKVRIIQKDQLSFHANGLSGNRTGEHFVPGVVPKDLKRILLTTVKTTTSLLPFLSILLHVP
jgi:hypothetical protein